MNPYRFGLGAATIVAFTVGFVMASSPPFREEAGTALRLAVGLGAGWLAVGAIGWEIRNRGARSQPDAGPGPTGD